MSGVTVARITEKVMKKENNKFYFLAECNEIEKIK
jgi:hypothetical protein